MPEEEAKPTTEIIPLPTGGSIAGIGGGALGAGTYLVNWLERTATLIERAVEGKIAHIEDALHPEPSPDVPVAPMPTEPVDVPEAAPTPETSTQAK